MGFSSQRNRSKMDRFVYGSKAPAGNLRGSPARQTSRSNWPRLCKRSFAWQLFGVPKSHANQKNRNVIL